MSPRIIEWATVAPGLEDLSALKSIGFACYCCGEDLVAPADDDGLFYDGEPAICPSCGWRTSTVVDEGDAWIQGESGDPFEPFDVRFNPPSIDVFEWVGDWFTSTGDAWPGAY